jgi:excisionase family DNA binding protein
MDNQQQLWDYKKAAHYLGISVSNLRHKKSQGKIEGFYFKIGGPVRFSKELLDKYLESTRGNENGKSN